jgi:WD40 repeat protein
VDLHPEEPWMLCSLYNGNVHIWNFQTQTLLKTFEVTELPVRSSKFVARKQWIVTGSDDLNIRVFNYNTMEKIKTFEAHSDYLRCVAVHPQLPYILTCSDDMTIKMWDWDRNWECKTTFEGHSHYVMQVRDEKDVAFAALFLLVFLVVIICVFINFRALLYCFRAVISGFQVVFNPKDPNTFASASLDRTIKVSERSRLTGESFCSAFLTQCQMLMDSGQDQLRVVLIFLVLTGVGSFIHSTPFYAGRARKGRQLHRLLCR